MPKGPARKCKALLAGKTKSNAVAFSAADQLYVGISDGTQKATLPVDGLQGSYRSIPLSLMMLRIFSGFPQIAGESYGRSG